MAAIMDYSYCPEDLDCTVYNITSSPLTHKQIEEQQTALSVASCEVTKDTKRKHIESGALTVIWLSALIFFTNMKLPELMLTLAVVIFISLVSLLALDYEDSPLLNGPWYSTPVIVAISLVTHLTVLFHLFFYVALNFPVAEEFAGSLSLKQLPPDLALSFLAVYLSPVIMTILYVRSIHYRKVDSEWNTYFHSKFFDTQSHPDYWIHLAKISKSHPQIAAYFNAVSTSGRLPVLGEYYAACRFAKTAKEDQKTQEKQERAKQAFDAVTGQSGNSLTS